MPLHIGELSGARVIKVGAGTTDALVGSTAPVLFDCLSHDAYPGQGGASILFTQIDVTLRAPNGYAIAVTPIVDGQPDQEQYFAGPAPATGTDGAFTIRAPFRLRGERIACRLRQTTSADSLEIADIAYEFVPLRSTTGR